MGKLTENSRLVWREGLSIYKPGATTGLERELNQSEDGSQTEKEVAGPKSAW